MTSLLSTQIFTQYFPHNKLKNILRVLTDFCFKDGKKQVIAVAKFVAT